jgi:hypothetical protein
MLKKLLSAVCFVIFANSFASVSIIENDENKIVVKISFDSVFYDGTRKIISNGNDFLYPISQNISLPMAFLNFTADKNSNPQISVSPQNRIVKKIPQTLEDRKSVV